MTLVLTVVALLGLILVAVGAVLWLFIKPANPVHVTLMVVGALVFSIAQAILLFDAIF
jgi:hypothetical protein